MLTFIKTYLRMSKPSTPRNILELSCDEKRKFLDSFDYVFSDIDGVVWNVAKVINGSSEGFRELRDAGKKITFITNNSVRTEELCLQKLNENNIPIEADDLMHPAKSIVEYLKSINFDGLIYTLASETFKDVLKKADFKLLDGPNEIISESFRGIMEKIVTHEPVKAVVIDFDFNMSQLKLMKAHFYLRKPECLLLAAATDLILPVTSDFSVLGPGGFVKVLAESTRQEVLTFGKPGKALAEVLMKRYKIQNPERILMIGDMLDQDIKFARDCGFQSLIVLSGGSSLEDVMKESDPSKIPNYYCEKMFDFVEFMRDLKKSNM